LFGQALDRLGTALERANREVLLRVAADLEHAGEQTTEHRDRQSVYAIAAMLRIEVRARTAAAGRAMHERAHRCLELAQRAGDEARALTLIEEDELRVQILAAEIARIVRHACSEGYGAYAARIRALMPGLWENDDLNPLGARTLASAALESFAGLSGTTEADDALRRFVLEHLPAPLASAIDELHGWLREQAVAPLAETGRTAQAQPPVAPGRRQAPPAGGPSSRATVDELASAAAGTGAGPGANTPAPGQAVAATAQAADAARMLGTSPFAAGDRAPKLDVLPTLQPVVEIERDAVAFAHSVGELPYSRDARGEFFGKVRSRLRAAGVASAQVAVVDVVSAMFDYVVDDRRLPEPARPLMWRLQQPAVALALLDPAYLGDDPRSLRRLIENLGAIANAFGDDLSRGSELHRRLETVVRAVEIVAGALQTRSAVMARQVELEYERAARNVTQLIDRVVQERATLESTPDRRNRRDYRRRPNREREQEVTARLLELLGDRLGRHQVPESVREFVLNVWLRHLRTAILRDGEDSAEYRVALQVVDDLLWSLDTLKARQSRRELAQKIPPLIGLLTQGLRAIGARDEEFKPFFDELFLIHLRKMQRRRRNGDSPDVRGTRRRPGDTSVDPATTGTGIDTRGGEPTTVHGPATGGGAAPAGPGGGVAAASGAGATGTKTAPDLAGASGLAGKAGEAGEAGGASPDAGIPRADSGAEPPLSGGTRPEAQEGTEQRLLEVLASLDLGDLPASPRRLPLPPDEALATLNRGDWIQLQARPGQMLFAKVAWINARRTVVLMVRHPDRRAMSMRSAELIERLQSGRAWRVV